MSLENNWRLSSHLTSTRTDRFVCEKTGNDTNDGTISNPRKSITEISYVRSGYYRLNNVLNGFQIILDGNCELDGSDLAFISNSKETAYIFHSIVPLSSKLVNSNIVGYNFNGGHGGATGLYGMIVENSTFTNSVDYKGVLSNHSLFLNCSLDLVGGSIGGLSIPSLYITSKIYKELVFKTTYISTIINLVGANTVFKKCAFDKDSKIGSNAINFSFQTCAFESGFNLTGLDIKNITLIGDPDIISNTYADGEKFSGSINNDSGTINFSDCFWTNDLGFNDAENGDFTLKASPQSILFNNANVIGCYDIAMKFDANHEAFDPVHSGVSYNNVTRTTGSAATFTLTTSGEGTVVSTDDPSKAINLGEATDLNKAIQFVQNFNYYNGQWIDRSNFDPSINDQVRLTYRLQIYDESEPNGANDTTNWSEWYELELFTPFETDASEKGNGAIDCDLTALAYKRAKRLRVEFTIRDNGI